MNARLLRDFFIAFPSGGRGTAIAVDKVFLRVVEGADPYRNVNVNIDCRRVFCAWRVVVAAEPLVSQITNDSTDLTFVGTGVLDCPFAGGASPSPTVM